MKRTYKLVAAAGAVAVLAGLAGCSGTTADAAESKPAEQTATVEETPAPVRTAPANDDERMCFAVKADTDVGDKRLDNVDAGEGERVERIAEDLERRLTAYPDADAGLKAQVQEVADAYSAAASKLGDTDAYAAQVVKLRAAQTKLLGSCA